LKSTAGVAIDAVMTTAAPPTARRFELMKTWHFESARHLTGIPPEHRCSRVHGSSFTVEVTVAAPLDPVTGWCVDFDDMEQQWRRLYEVLDHRLLNEVEGLENPTTEHIAVWILDRLKFDGATVTKVAVAELPTAKVTVYA
jgi:6-pyruvoyltetrahydropterin/6-carboxytetrahydropterin synthase